MPTRSSSKDRLKYHEKTITISSWPYWPNAGEYEMLRLAEGDAHRHHPQPFTEEEFRPYRHATVPESQKEAVRRRKVMRTARSTKRRPSLLRNLEQRYAASVWH